VVAAEVPLLAQAGAHVGHASVRRRGTVVGSVAFADPSAELPAALLALDGEAVVAGREGERTIAASDLFTGAFSTSLRDGELVTAIRVPRGGDARAGTAWIEVARRHGDLPVCGAGAVVTLDDAGRIASARIALCGVGDRPVRATAAEEALRGAEPTAEAVASAAASAGRDLEPPGDPHGSPEYRRHLAVVVTRRCVQRAVEGVARA
jgi:carbon-monoxide dehydrogenase medium subunit